MQRNRPLSRKASAALRRDVAAALDAAERAVTLHVWFASPAQPRVFGLWAFDTHTVPHAPPDAAAILDISSAEPACGKTTFAEVAAEVVRAPLLASNISTPALYRVMESVQPTLFWDEFDGFQSSGGDRFGEVIAIFNGGYRQGSRVIRCEPPHWEPEEFDTFGHKAVVRIGARPLPAAMQSRCTPIVMQRKTSDEPVERFRRRRDVPALHAVRDLFADVAERASRHLVDVEPDDLDDLSDRQYELVARLVAIADLAGDDYGERARQDVRELFDTARSDDTPLSAVLLAHLREEFRRHDGEHVFAEALLDALNSRDDAPWPRFGRDRDGMTARDLARMLKPYGIEPRTVRIGATTGKGYSRSAFAEAWKRYAPSQNGRTLALPKERHKTSRRHTKPPRPNPLRDGVTAGDALPKGRARGVNLLSRKPK